MAEKKSWGFGDLEGYIRQGEPDQAARADNWQVAIGLQAVDGLKPSAYLLETAKEHIEGRIGIDEAQRRIRSYYEERGGREKSGDSEEADTVSSRIAEILERFFENQLCGANHELKNRYLHLDWPQRAREQGYSTTQDNLETTQETTQEKLLALIKANPALTAKQLSTMLGISFDGVRYHLAKLRKAGVIHHEGPTKNGKWVIDE